MRGATVAGDRVIVLLVGLAAAVGGLALALWSSQQWERVTGLPEPAPLDLAPLPDLLSGERAIGWFPWALGAAGVVLVILGLWWLLAHLPARAGGDVVLPGSGTDGRLTAQAGAVADAAAVALQSWSADVLSAKASLARERHRPVVRLRARVEPGTDLRELARGIDDVGVKVRRMLARDDIAMRVEISVSSRRARRRAA